VVLGSDDCDRGCGLALRSRVLPPELRSHGEKEEEGGPGGGGTAQELIHTCTLTRCTLSRPSVVARPRYFARSSRAAD